MSLVKERVPKARTTTVFTIGHSTRTLEEFLSLLKVYGVQRVVDIRTIPGSYHAPQFNRETLKNSLETAGVKYAHMPSLGGLRRALKNSKNTGWRNPTFRGFADYMQTEEFQKGLEELMRRAGEEKVAIMCAEAVPWRCHRSLIADALTVRGINVEHILSATSLQTHKVTPWAKTRGSHVTYPPPTKPKKT
jgi:uncharacterized protein (DUF488 family)